jgi:hypothetical protein
VNFGNLIKEKTQSRLHKIALRQRLDEWIAKDGKAHTAEINKLFNAITINRSKIGDIDMGNYFPSMCKSEFELCVPLTKEVITFDFEATGPYDRSSGVAIYITYQSEYSHKFRISLLILGIRITKKRCWI